MTASWHFGPAWLALTVAFGLHAVDEAVNNFLSVYNPAVRALREVLPQLPLPTFTFQTWIGLLAFSTVVLLAVTPLAFAGVRVLRPVAWAFAVVMVANALLHIGASMATSRMIPGLYTAPLVLATAVWLGVQLIRTRSTPEFTPA